METQVQEKAPILESAWKKFAEFDAVSFERTGTYTRLRQWIAVFGVLATLFAIVSSNYSELFSPLINYILHFLLIVSPIVASGVAAFTNNNFSSGDWLILRAGAEEVLKNIYFYRTILQKNKNRDHWLEEKLNEVQRSVFRGMNGEFILKPFKGELPPSPRFGYEGSDPGFNDLTGEDYFKYRLENELNWHIKKINQKQKERLRLKTLIIISGAAGAVLAALNFNIWVALTASITTTMLGWQELKNLDLVVRNYSKVILELGIIADHWKNIAQPKKTQSEFYKMVNFTEDLLWSRNVEYIKAMQEALKESGISKEASLINTIIDEQVAADHKIKEDIEKTITDEVKSAIDEAADTINEEFKEVFTSLAEEASSDLVQAELASMKESFQEMMETAIETIKEKTGLASSLKTIVNDYEGLEITSNTSKSVLNDLMSQYPETGELKG